MQTSFSTIRTVAHNLQITAILKLPKLALCPLPAHYNTVSSWGRVGEGELSNDAGSLNLFKGSIDDLNGLINISLLNR